MNPRKIYCQSKQNEAKLNGQHFIAQIDSDPECTVKAAWEILNVKEI